MGSAVEKFPSTISWNPVKGILRLLQSLMCETLDPISAEYVTQYEADVTGRILPIEVVLSHCQNLYSRS